MSNLILSIFIIIFCSIGYFFSWICQTKNKFNIALLLFILCGLILRIYTSADFFLHTWDEKYHAVVAKNLIHHPFTPTLYDNPILPYSFKDWTSNHIWVHKQPFPLWIMAISMWAFGVNEIALRLPSIILTTIGIFLTFSIATYFFNKKTAYIAAFLYSINGLIIELTAGRVATDHTDIFFLFFVELAIFFSIIFVQKQNTIYNILAGVSIGAAVLSKWLPALIVLPIWVLIVIDSKNFSLKKTIFQFILLTTTCVLVFLPWQIYIFNMFPLEANWEANYNFRHITEALEEQTRPFYYFLNRIRKDYGELIYLPLIWFFWKTFKNLKNKKRWAIFIWFFIPLLFFSFAKTKMKAYLLFTSPALFMMTAEFWDFIYSYKENQKLKWVFNLVLILLIILPIRYSIERIKPFENIDRSPKWTLALKNLNKKQIPKGVLFNYDKPIEAMFYTNLTAYSYIPDNEVIYNLIKKGYTVIINDNDKIPDNIKTINGIVIEKL